MKPLIFCQLILFLAVNNAHARTREEVLVDAAVYANHPWAASGNNILDVKKYVIGSTTPIHGEGDGIDDRMGIIFDRNGDGVIDIGDINDDNRQNWPFVVGSTVTGEAYAFGGWTDGARWGADTPDMFTGYLARAPQKWISGAREGADVLVGTKTIMPQGYTGYTGIDCSGLAGNALNVNKLASDGYKFNALQLAGQSLLISTSTVKAGDLLVRTVIVKNREVGKHVMVVKEVFSSSITVYHAATHSFDTGKHVRRVIEETIRMSDKNNNQVLLEDARWNNNPYAYYTYSPFPQFAWTSPTKDNPELDPLVPVIALEVVSKSSVAPSSVKLVIDEGKPKAIIITPGTTGYALAPSTSNSTHVSVRFEFPPDLALSSGPHSVTAYAGNVIGLNDISSMTFQVVPGTNPPTIAWADYGGPGELFGELKGTNTITTAPWLHTEGVGLYLKPDRNLLRDFNIHADDTMGGALSAVTFTAGVRNVVIDTALSGFQEKTGYYARLADVMANTTTMYFHLDKVGPVIETTVTVRLDGTGTGFVFDTAGRAVDSMSGLGGEVLLSTGSGTVPLYAGQSWPTGPAETTYAFTGLLGDYSVLAYDRSGWPGHFNLQLSTWTQNLSLSNRATVNDSAGGGNAGTILKEARLVVSGLSPELPPNSYWVIPPEGMKMELWADSEDMDMPDFPVQYGHPRTSQAKLLERTVNGTTAEGIFDLPMKAQTGLRLEPGYNTNATKYKTHVDTDDDGFLDTWVETAEPSGVYTFGADATAVIAAGHLNGMRHFNQWVPVGEAQWLQSDNLNVVIRNVTKGGSLRVETARGALGDEGYKQTGPIYEIKTTAEFAGPAELMINFCEGNHTDRQRKAPAIVHCKEGVVECVKLETTVDNCVAKATVPGFSPFGVVVPIDDDSPPRTALAFIGAQTYVDDRLWVSTETYLDLTADDRSPVGDVSGVARTWSLVDAAPDAACLAEPHDPAAAPGTCANPYYGGVFPLKEGAHSLYYWSKDHWNNSEPVSTRTIYADGTPPAAWASVAGSTVADGGTAYLLATDSVTLGAIDPVSNGVARLL